MFFSNVKDEYEVIHEAYGLTLKAKLATLNYSSIPGGPFEVVHEFLIRNDEGVLVYHRKLNENTSVRTDWLKQNVDSLLYWVNDEKPAAYDIERIVDHNLVSTSSLFFHLVDAKKRREQRRAYVV